MRTPLWNPYTVPNPFLFRLFPALSYCENSGDDEQTVSLAVPASGEKPPLVMFFHGGGMVSGDRGCPDELYDGRFAVAEPRYRLSGHAKAPAQLEDAADAIAWAFHNADRYGYDPEKIFVGGMSAGAYLAAITVMDPHWLSDRGVRRKVAGLLLVSGQMTAHFQIKEDLGRDTRQFHPLFDELAPLAHLSADLPPLLAVTGESGLDMPARPEENAFLCASLRAMGHPRVEYHMLPGCDHVGAFNGCGPVLLRFLESLI